MARRASRPTPFVGVPTWLCLSAVEPSRFALRALQVGTNYWLAMCSPDPGETPSAASIVNADKKRHAKAQKT